LKIKSDLSNEKDKNIFLLDLKELNYQWTPDYVGIYYWKVIPFVTAKNGSKIVANNCSTRSFVVKRVPVQIAIFFGESAVKYKEAVIRELNGMEDKEIIFEEVDKKPFPETLLFVEVLVNIRVEEMLKNSLNHLTREGASNIVLLALRSGTNTSKFDKLPKASGVSYQTELVVHPYLTTSIVNSGKQEVITTLKELVAFFLTT